MARRLSLLLAALVAFGCASVRVETDYDPDAEFFALRRFAWLEPPLREEPEAPGSGAADPFVHNTLLDKRVRAAVEGALGRRGYERSGPDEADFLLRYRALLRERTVVQPPVVHGGIHQPPFTYSGYYGTYTYEEGTLILDVIDPETEQILWRGWGRGRLDEEHLDAEEIRLYVDEILARFPPDESDAPEA